MGNCVAKQKDSKKHNTKHREKTKHPSEERKSESSDDIIHRHVGKFIETDSK